MSFLKFTAPMISLLLTSTSFAETYTVNSTDDPQLVNPANCMTPMLACSLRDALAAADQSMLHDTVEFEIDGTIYLTRPLAAILQCAVKRRHFSVGETPTR